MKSVYARCQGWDMRAATSHAKIRGQNTQKEEQLGRPKAGRWPRQCAVGYRAEMKSWRARVQEAPDGACPVSQEQGSHGGR